MKKRKAFFILSIILGSALLFNQVGLNFFHDRHNAHEIFSGPQKNQTILLNHGEHCQVCSLEILFNVVLPVATEVPRPAIIAEFEVCTSHQSVVIFIALSQGRAPPVA